MSHSNKARHGTNTKRWKDSVGRSRSQVRSRAKWRKVTKNSPKKQMHTRILRGSSAPRPLPLGGWNENPRPEEQAHNDRLLAKLDPSEKP